MQHIISTIASNHFADLDVSLQLYLAVFDASTIASLAIRTTSPSIILLIMCVLNVRHTLVRMFLQAAKQALFLYTEAD